MRGVCAFYIGYEIKFIILYKYGFLLTLYTYFKVVRVPLGPKQTISTRLGANRYTSNVHHEGVEVQVLLEVGQVGALTDLSVTSIMF